MSSLDMTTPRNSELLDASLGNWSPGIQEESHGAQASSTAVSKKLPEYKAVMVGTSGVGKSALTIQLNYDRFVEDYDPTIQDSYWKEVVLGNEGCVLNVLDTSGQPAHKALRDQCLAVGDGVLCVFSLEDPSSLIHLKQMRAAWGPHYTRPLILVGNKCDLVAGIGDVHAAAIDLAKSWGVPFVETSAKTRQGVDEAFSMLILEIQRAQENMAREIEAKSSGQKGGHSKATCRCGCTVA